ncbi:MAG: PIN domain-containing protein [Chloroflexales bacterium]|nr:PIN domain-containing protein [Chloroflexales bacterium]
MFGKELVFLDSSVVVHAAGNIGYTWAVAILNQGLTREQALVTDTLCLQEVEDILSHLLEPDQVIHALEVYRAAVTEVIAVTADDFAQSRVLRRRYAHVSPRECLHAAVMQRANICKVCAVTESTYREFAELEYVVLLKED